MLKLFLLVYHLVNLGQICWCCFSCIDALLELRSESCNNPIVARIKKAYIALVYYFKLSSVKWCLKSSLMEPLCWFYIFRLGRVVASEISLYQFEFSNAHVLVEVFWLLILGICGRALFGSCFLATLTFEVKEYSWLDTIIIWCNRIGALRS